MSTIHYANPAETTFTGSVFEFQFGAYGETIVRVIHKPDHVDSALELAAEWLAENAPIHFMDPEYLAELHKEACDDRGLTYPPPKDADLDAGGYYDAFQDAESDLTYTESGYLTSYEWSVQEMSESDVFVRPTFDHLDICQAYATYYASYHQGQGSHGYQRLSKALELCSPIRSFDELSENGQAIYRRLAISEGR